MLKGADILSEKEDQLLRIFTLLRFLGAFFLALVWLLGVICLGFVCASMAMPNVMPFRVSNISEAMPMWVWLLLFFPALCSIPVLVRQFICGSSVFQRAPRK